MDQMVKLAYDSLLPWGYIVRKSWKCWQWLWQLELRSHSPRVLDQKLDSCKLQCARWEFKPSRSDSARDVLLVRTLFWDPCLLSAVYPRSFVSWVHQSKYIFRIEAILSLFLMFSQGDNRSFVYKSNRLHKAVKSCSTPWPNQSVIF